MNYKLLITDEAGIEIIEAYLWYEEQSLGLGERFLQELDIVYEAITDSPFAFEVQFKGFRQALLYKFPYLVVYKVKNTSVVVFSVFHTSRDPDAKNVPSD